MPETLRPALTKSIADPRQTNASSKVYSIRSCPCSSCKNSFSTRLLRCVAAIPNGAAIAGLRQYCPRWIARCRSKVIFLTRTVSNGRTDGLVRSSIFVSKQVQVQVAQMPDHGERIAPVLCMLEALLNYFFGCTHQRTTFPLTPAAKLGSAARKRQGTYVVCLKCGVEFAYDWERMRIGMPMPTHGLVRSALSWSALESSSEEIV
jgi:hypothetical protein